MSGAPGAGSWLSAGVLATLALLLAVFARYDNPSPSLKVHVTRAQPVTLALEAEDSTIRVRARLEFEAGHVRAIYEATNLDRLPLLLFDAPLRLARDGNLKHDPQLFFVSMGNSDMLALKRIVPPLPTTFSVERAILAWGHRVPVGAATRGEGVVTLPATEFNPYFPPAEDTPYRQATARAVKLVFEYIALDEGSVAQPVPGTADLFEYRREGPTHSRIRVIELSGPLPHPIAVRQRADRFERL